MTRELSILYRGPLSSCNYDCSYCPFAKRHETAEELARDCEALQRFVRWVCGQTQPLRIFITPWGEALTRAWYHDAFEQLLEQEQVVRLVAQTNLSWVSNPAGFPNWMSGSHRDRVALWCTWHPSQTSLEEFLERSHVLLQSGISHSVGMVAIPDDIPRAHALRAELPDSVYLWLNAWDMGDGQKYAYSAEQMDVLRAIDPYFGFNTIDHPSLGRDCLAGSSVVSVDGDGTVRRCHFVADPVGNLYDGSFCPAEEALPCPNADCGCFIGYVHLKHLQQWEIYGNRVLERIPLTYQ